MNSLLSKGVHEKTSDCDDDLTRRSPLLSYGMKLTVPPQNMSCYRNCSGHGDCYDGVCFCEVRIHSLLSLLKIQDFHPSYFVHKFTNVIFSSLIQVEFSGKACNDPNLSYYLAFSTIFYIICVTSFIQLVKK